MQSLDGLDCSKVIEYTSRFQNSTNENIPGCPTIKANIGRVIVTLTHDTDPSIIALYIPATIPGDLVNGSGTQKSPNTTNVSGHIKNTRSRGVFPKTVF